MHLVALFFFFGCLFAVGVLGKQFRCQEGLERYHIGT